MNDLICWLIGSLISISIYLILSPNVMRWLFGMVILSSTVNLVIFVAGRLNSQNPPFVLQNLEVSELLIANPLPQALILTAIVIGFGLLAFSLVLVRNIWQTFHHTNSDFLHNSESTPSTIMEDEV